MFTQEEIKEVPRLRQDICPLSNEWDYEEHRTVTLVIQQLIQRGFQVRIGVVITQYHCGQ